MKTIKLFSLFIAVFLSLPTALLGQAPKMGSMADFVLFSRDGAIGNTGISHITGNVGTNKGAITIAGNVNGVLHNADSATSQGSRDLLNLFNIIDSTTATFFPAATLGNGDTLYEGVYSVPSLASLDGTLYLDAGGNANAVFIVKIGGAFSSSAASKIVLLNGALACNIFWNVRGLVSIAAGTEFKGTIIAYNAAISIGSGVKLEGRALSTTGAVTVNTVLAYIPIGCGSKSLKGPVPPALNSVECYALFSSSGAVTNSGITTVKGDVGTNSGAATGFDTLLVNGKVHANPDASTAKCSTDLILVNQYLDSLVYDIELLYPAELGNNLVLTPHTYIMKAAATLTDTLIMDAQGDSSAVFVLQIGGALTTGTYSNIKLINGAKSKNIYWTVNGAVTIKNYSVFRGTLISNNGALGAINTGVELDGRALTTSGALNTIAISVVMPTVCGGSSVISPKIVTEPLNQVACNNLPVVFTVVATGTGLQYQWRKGTAILGNTGNMSGTNTSQLTINPVTSSDTASDYNVIVSGSALPNDTSRNAMLSICTGSGLKTNITSGIGHANVYPNPFSNAINVDLTAFSGSSVNKWTLYNSFGETVIEMIIADQKNLIGTGELPAGIYFYKIVSDGLTLQTGKLVSE